MRTVPKIVGYEFLDGRFYADIVNRDVFRKGDPKPIHLAPKEFDVLEFFLKLKNPNQLVKRNAITPLEGPYSRNPADDYLSKITSKLGLAKGELVRNKSGIGYSLIGTVRPVAESDSHPKSDVFEASEQYFKAHTTDSMRISLKQCLQELETNPDNPDAHVIAAYNYINLCQSAYAALLPEKGILEARRHATRAFALNPKSSRALAALGLISMIYEHNWKDAKTHLENAVALKSGEGRTLLVYSHFLVATGRVPEALAAIQEAVKLDSNDRLTQATVGWIHLYAGDVSKAIQCGERAVALYPDSPLANNMLGRSYEAAGRYAEAQQHFEFALKVDYSPANLASAGYLRAMRGDSKAAQGSLNSMKQLFESGKISYIPAFFQAHVLVGLGKTEECLDALWVAYEQRTDWLIHLGVEKRWTPIREQKEFRELVEQVGIAPPEKSLSAKG